MAFRPICVALLLTSLPVAGCGTVANLACSPPEEGGKSPFGGVGRDVDCIKKAANGEFTFKAHPESDPVQHPQVAPMLVSAAGPPVQSHRRCRDVALYGGVHFRQSAGTRTTCCRGPAPAAPIARAGEGAGGQNGAAAQAAHAPPSRANRSATGSTAPSGHQSGRCRPRRPELTPARGTAPAALALEHGRQARRPRLVPSQKASAKKIIRARILLRADADGDLDRCYADIAR